MDYVVIYERAGDGTWSAYSPDVDGCVTSAATREEAEALFPGALSLFLDHLRQTGRAMPQSRSAAGIVSIAV